VDHDQQTGLEDRHRDAVWSLHEMSNFDQSVDPGLEPDLRAGMRGVRSAWNFQGQVWHDADADIFREEVWVGHVLEALRSAPTLGELMRTVNDEFGCA
jgi:hypothetical protein